MDKISYVVWWLKCVEEEIHTKPKDWFHHWTHINYSGGFTGWEEPINGVYFKPEGFEERLLQGEVHAYMLVALESALLQAERSATDPLDVAEAYRIAQMVSVMDPLVAAAAKVRLNNLCAGLRKFKTLLEQASRGFGLLIMSNPDECLTW